MSGRRTRVLVTGIGLVTPLGADAPSSWAAVCAGRSGIGPIRRFDASGFPVRIGAHAPDVEAAPLAPRARKYAARQHVFAAVAAAEALRDARVVPGSADTERWGCVVGSGMLGVEFAELAALQRRAAPAGVLEVERLEPTADPVAFARHQSIGGLALLVQQFGIRGPVSAVHTACASGGQAIGAALRLIRRGAADRVLAGGFDSMLTPVGLAGFCLLGALSPDNDEPARASRPFDRTRNGFVLGEGAGFLVLESAPAAAARGARAYAELAGAGDALSSYRITDPHPDGNGPIQAMRRALADADIAPEAVDYINAHGTSTVMNDRSEAAAIRAVFGSHCERLLVSSTKSLMGHLIAAAGAVEAALCALALRYGVAPVNANLTTRDPECDVPLVVGASQRRPLQVALSNSFGFGGANNAVVLRRAPDEEPGG
ncbi:MAG: beta-ketoacyl synthase [Candidatus Binatia bacterium]